MNPASYGFADRTPHQRDVPHGALGESRTRILSLRRAVLDPFKVRARCVTGRSRAARVSGGIAELAPTAHPGGDRDPGFFHGVYPGRARMRCQVPAAGLEPAMPKPRFYRPLPCRLGSRWLGVTGEARTRLSGFTARRLSLFGFSHHGCPAALAHSGLQATAPGRLRLRMLTGRNPVSAGIVGTAGIEPATGTGCGPAAHTAELCSRGAPKGTRTPITGSVDQCPIRWTIGAW